MSNRVMETNDERRRRKLADLALQYGLAEIAHKASMSMAALDQILKGVELPPKKGDGSRSKRGLGDSAARAIEAGFGLERGWFDNDQGTVDMTAKELQLVGYFRELDKTLQSIMLENIREAVEQQSRMREGLKLAVPKMKSARSQDGS